MRRRAFIGALVGSLSASRVVGQAEQDALPNSCILYNPTSLHTTEFNGTESGSTCARQITNIDRISGGFVISARDQAGDEIARLESDTDAKQNTGRSMGMRMRGQSGSDGMKAWFDDIRVLGGSLIDGAEDADIKEYVQSSFDQWYVSSDSYVGDWSIASENTAGAGGYNPSLIAFMENESTLPYYPQLGDVISFWTKYTDHNHTIKFAFGITDEADIGSSIDNGFTVVWGRRGTRGGNSPYLTIDDKTDGNRTVIDSTTFPFEEYTNEWIRILISWGDQSDRV